MQVTIKDVAKAADVSIATVSRVINNKGYIGIDTRARVNKAIDELNYMPNTSAIKLQGKHDKTIGVILPSLENPLYSELYVDIEKSLSQTHYQTLLCTTSNLPEKEREYFSLLKANQVRGIITSSHSNFLKNIESIDYPVVSFDRNISKSIPVVNSNNFAGGVLVGKKVIDEHKKDILILSGSEEDFYPINDRIKGMLSVFNESQVNIATAGLKFDSSMAVKNLLVEQIINNNQYDAICCTDDLTALIVRRVSQKSSYHPLITSYDGSSFVRNFFPDLITVQQPINEIADLMCNILIKKIEYPSFKAESEYSFPVTIN